MRKLLVLAVIGGHRLVVPQPRRREDAAERHDRLRRRLVRDARAGIARARPAAADRLRGRGSVTSTTSGACSSSTRCSRATSCSGRASARPGTSTSTGSRPGPTCCARSESASPRSSREVEPDAVRLAGPALGAVALAASASMASELPFIIVRGETKEYGTANRIEGPFDRGDLVCLLEDVVTSGGALAESVSALREAGLVVRNAVCVVDREEGGADALARLGVRLRALYRASDLLAGRSPVSSPVPANARSRRAPTGRRSARKIRMVEPKPPGVLGSPAVPTTTIEQEEWQ